MAQTFIPIPIAEISEAKEAPSLTYKLDLDNGRIVGKIDGLNAVKQAILKALITPRFKCLIYDNQYGSELQTAASGNGGTSEYTVAAMKGFIKDALLPDSRILSVHDFQFEFEGDCTYIYFVADTIFGTTKIEGVVKNVF